MSNNTRVTVASLANDFNNFVVAQEAHNANVTAILAKLCDGAPATVTTEVVETKTEKEQKSEEFVAWLRDSAPARKARKEDNALLAADLRSRGLVPNGLVWAAAKKGETNLRTLKALAKKDAAARKA